MGKRVLRTIAGVCLLAGMLWMRGWAAGSGGIEVTDQAGSSDIKVPVPTISELGTTAVATVQLSVRDADTKEEIHDPSLKWTLDDNGIPGVTLDQNGLLQVDNTALGGTVAVQARSGDRKEGLQITLVQAAREITFIQIGRKSDDSFQEEFITEDTIIKPPQGGEGGRVVYTAYVYDQYGTDLLASGCIQKDGISWIFDNEHSNGKTKVLYVTDQFKCKGYDLEVTATLAFHSKTEVIKVTVADTLPERELSVSMADLTVGEEPPDPDYSVQGTPNGPVEVLYQGVGDTAYPQSSQCPTQVGRYCVTVTYPTRTARYSGTACFSILPIDLTRAQVELDRQSYTYSGGECRPEVTLILDGKELQSGTDYSVCYPANIVDVGDRLVTITGRGSYAGELQAAYEIVPQQVEIWSVTVRDRSYRPGDCAVEVCQVIFSVPDLRWTAQAAMEGPEAGADKAVEVQVALDEHNYALKDGTWTARVTILPQVLTLPELAWTGGFVYDGGERQVSLLGLPEGVTARLSGDRATYAGSYTAVAELSCRDDNYTLAVPTVEHVWTIAPAGQAVRHPDTAAVTRGGNALELDELVEGARGATSFAVTAGEGRLEGSVFISGDTTGAAAIGISVDGVDVDGDGTWEYLPYTGEIQVDVVEKRTEELAVTIEGWTFGDSPNAPAFAAPGDSTVTVLYSGSAQVPAQPGEYHVTVVCETRDCVYVGSTLLTISPAAAPDPDPEPDPDPDPDPTADPDPAPGARPEPSVRPERPGVPDRGPEPPEVEEHPLPFADVDREAWYGRAVEQMYWAGLMSGVAEDAFGPWQEVDRAMIVTILWRMAGAPEPGEGRRCSDVPADAWYADAVCWAAAQGVASGYGDGTFAPADSLTREQTALMLYTFAGRPPVGREDPGYPDSGAVSPWAWRAVCWAVEQRLLSHRGDGLLAPADRLCRAELAQILTRYMQQRG